MNTLYIVSTPIGNLDDISFRAIEILKKVSFVFAEDTRRSGKLFQHFEIDTVLKSYHEHNVEKAIPEVLQSLQQGDVALISDSGTPLISDPGFKLVRELKVLGYNIQTVPGANALLTALTSSGLPTDKFSFRGFLPKKKSQMLKEFDFVKDREETIIYYESPYRIIKTLKVIKESLGAERVICVARELTKIHEDVITGTVDDILQNYEKKSPKGEFVVLIAKKDYLFTSIQMKGV